MHLCFLLLHSLLHSSHPLLFQSLHHLGQGVIDLPYFIKPRIHIRNHSTLSRSDLIHNLSQSADRCEHLSPGKSIQHTDSQHRQHCDNKQQQLLYIHHTPEVGFICCKNPEISIADPLTVNLVFSDTIRVFFSGVLHLSRQFQLFSQLFVLQNDTVL